MNTGDVSDYYYQSFFDSFGQLAHTKKECNNMLNITTLAAATYFYEVKVGSEVYRGKLVVVR